MPQKRRRPCRHGSTAVCRRLPIWPGYTHCAPALKRHHGAEIRIGGIAVDRDQSAFALLIRLAAADEHGQAAPEDDGDLAEGDGHQLGALEPGAEADQQHGPMAGGERRGRAARAAGEPAGIEHAPEQGRDGGCGLALRPLALFRW
jgi:hypothetical protein